MRRVIGAIATLVLLSIACGRPPSLGGASSSATPAPATLSPSPTNVCSNTEVPPARSLAAFAYVPSRQEAVLFGGFDASNKLLNDTWVRQSGCWTQLHPAQSAPANTILASAFDANSGDLVVLLYGASGGPDYLSLATWVWDGRNWLQATGTSPRISAGQAAYDPVARRVILFALAEAGGMAHTWTWDGMQWKQLVPQTSPPPRQETTVAPFGREGRSLLIGGLGSSGVVLNDAWQWDGSAWSAIPSLGANCCSAAIDEGNDVVIFGGGSDHATNQTRLWNGTVWTVAA